MWDIINKRLFIKEAISIAASGGICGKAISGTITGCTSSANIRTIINYSEKSQSYAGGICGICENGTVIDNCYFSGEIDNCQIFSETK